MSEDKSFVQPAIPRFDGHYDHWSMLMENLLRSKGYWHLVECGYDVAEGVELTEVQQKELEDLITKDLKVKNYLFQAIDRTILEQILEKRTSKQIWDSMKKKFAGNARVKRSLLQALRRDFEVLEMKVGETITEYFARIMNVATKMRSNGEDMKEVTIVEKILRTLTEKFNYVVVSIEESKDIDKLTIDELQSSLVVHEQKFIKSSGEEQALTVRLDNVGTRGRGRGRQIFNRATIECFKCHKLGHYQYERPSLDKEVNYAEFDEEEEILLMSHVGLPQHQTSKEDAWFLDSGCSNHMCGDKSNFNEIDESFRHVVKLGNNTKMNVFSKGNVKLNVNGVTHVIQDVFYVPELKNNLLSIGQLQEKGLPIMFKLGGCNIYHPHKGLILQIKMTPNRMFILPARISKKRKYASTPQHKNFLICGIADTSSQPPRFTIASEKRDGSWLAFAAYLYNYVY